MFQSQFVILLLLAGDVSLNPGSSGSITELKLQQYMFELLNRKCNIAKFGHCGSDRNMVKT